MRYNRKGALCFAKENINKNTNAHGCDGGATAFVSDCLQKGFGSNWKPSCDADFLYYGLLEHELAVDAEICELDLGDIVQLKTSSSAPYKSLIVTGIAEDSTLLVSSKAYISIGRRLDSYSCCGMRCLHIKV